jgi:hypothetical protein
MKTQVVMKRPLFGSEISQQSKTEFFSASDLVAAGNKWRLDSGLPLFNMNEWFRQKGPQEFIHELEQKFGAVKIASRGRGTHTWVHPLLFIDMALAISPKLKIEVYEWLYDHLLRYRNDSGDSFKRMCGALYVRTRRKSQFDASIRRLALKIQYACKVEDWQKATEDQLALRDKIHNNIALLAEVMPKLEAAIRIGIEKALEAHAKSE